MAGITRATAQLFSTTGLTGTGGFGAAAAGTVTTEAGNSNSISNIQTGTAGAWAAGWLAAVLGASKFPAVEDMNAVNNVFSTQIAYILERGIPEYDAGTTYNTGDIARGVGLTTLYSSLGDGNIGHVLSNATYWKFLCDLSSLSANVFISGTTTGSANAQTLASVTPATGLTPVNGQTIIFTAGFTNTGAATLAITSPSIGATAINKIGNTGLTALTGSEIYVGDTVEVSWNSTSGVWVLTSGLDGVGTVITNSLGSDVSLSSTSTYYDGPSIAQGTSGTWWVSGQITVSLNNGNTGDVFLVELWDGTTVINSTVIAGSQGYGESHMFCSLSGYLASPAGNIRISVKSTVATNNKIVYNASGNSKDSTINAVRIA